MTDLKFAIRQLLKNPGFSALIVITLALGIGLNTSMFALFDAVALRPVQVSDPSTIVKVYQTSVSTSAAYKPFSYPEYVAIRDLNEVFSGLVAYSWIPARLNTGANESGTATTPARGVLVSGNYFSVVGGGVELGRAIEPDEDQSPGSAPVVVLSHNLWQARFQADPAVVGKMVKLNGVSFTVVGVVTKNFTGFDPQRPDFWAPIKMQPLLMPNDERLHDRGSFWLDVAARLKPDVTRGKAEAGMNLLVNQLGPDYLGGDQRARVTLTTSSFVSRPDVRGQVNSVAFLVFGALGAVLLIACANLANLFLARAIARQKEIALRLSLGATRIRLVRQLLTETLLTAIIGGGLGLLLAWWIPPVLITILQPPFEQPFNVHVALDLPVLGFNLLLSIIAGILFGLAPAFQASKANLYSTMKSEDTMFGLSGGRTRLQSLLVSAQISLCLVLLLSAGLLLRSLDKAQDLDTGFDTKHLLAASLDLKFHGYDDARAAEFQRRLIDRVHAIPGVKDVCLASLAPLGGISRAGPLAFQGLATSETVQHRFVDYWVVSSQYFKTLGVPLVKGRYFNSQDARKGVPVAIINEAMAREFWADENPLGKMVRLGPPTVPFTEIVGVVKNTRGARLWEMNQPYVYLPYFETAEGPPVQTSHLGATLLVRTASYPELVMGMVQRVSKTLDPTVQVAISPLSKNLGRWLWFSEVGAALASGVGFLALILASVGVYGLMSYVVNRRTHEVGIRMALGASQKNVLTLVIGQSLRLTLVGVTLGLILALAATRMIAGTLYGVSSTDPLTFTGVPLFLTTIALLAAYIPAKRATKVNPLEALRHE